jgi:uncharacterized protein (DUF433 family)
MASKQKSNPQRHSAAIRAVRRDIVATPGICGGDARISGTRIPVWVLEQARRLRIPSVDILADYLVLSCKDLEMAWDYAARHRAEISDQIRQNGG